FRIRGGGAMKYFVTVGARTIEVEVDGTRVTVDGVGVETDLAAVSGTPLYHLLLGGEAWTVAGGPLAVAGRGGRGRGGGGGGGPVCRQRRRPGHRGGGGRAPWGRGGGGGRDRSRRRFGDATLSSAAGWRVVDRGGRAARGCRPLGVGAGGGAGGSLGA